MVDLDAMLGDDDPTDRGLPRIPEPRRATHRGRRSVVEDTPRRRPADPGRRGPAASRESASRHAAGIAAALGFRPLRERYGARLGRACSCGAREGWPCVEGPRASPRSEPHPHR